MLNTASDDTFKKRWSDEQARAVSAVAAKDIAQRLQETEVRSFQKSSTSSIVQKVVAKNNLVLFNLLTMDLIIESFYILIIVNKYL